MTAVLPFPGPPTLDELRDARGTLPTPSAADWDRPLIASLIAAGLDLSARCAGCGEPPDGDGAPLVDHFGPLVQGEGPYRGLWYGSVDCCGGPGAPGSREALVSMYGTADAVELHDLPFVLSEDRAAAEWHANSGQAAA